MYTVTDRMIRILEKHDQEGRKDAALLAALRNSAGKTVDGAEDVWPFLFDNLPESFLGVNGRPTFEENAVFTALQIYAICRQGTVQNAQADETYRGSMGKSLASGRNADSAALDRRFNAMLTAEATDEFFYYLRQLVKLVKSRTSMKVNFAKLAEDLYWYQKGGKKQVCFRWATDYYSTRPEREPGSKEEENDHD